MNPSTLNKAGLGNYYMDHFGDELGGIDWVIASFSGSVGDIVEQLRAA